MNSALNQREQPVRALLLGDSIRMGYLPYVRDASADLADVIGLEDNCEDSGNVLANLDRWLGARAWRVIHFNCCLHDIKIDRWTGICKTPLDHYRDNLRGVCARLHKTGAELIWATTTPVIYERHLTKTFDRREEDVLTYNQVALDVISEHGIQVNDLHAVAVGSRAIGVDPSLPLGVILATKDGGKTWTNQPTPVDDVAFWKVSFAGARR